MKILHLCSFSGNLGDCIRIQKMHEHLQRRGDEIHFVNLPATRYPRRRILSRPDMMKRIIVGKMRLEKTELIRQSLRLRLGVEALSKGITAFRPELILCETIFPALVAIHTVEDTVPVITDAHSIPSAEYEGDIFREINRENVDYLRDVEGLVFRRSAGIIAISDPMKSYIAEKYNIHSDRICVIPNGSDIREQVSQYREPMRVVYGGIFSYWENVDSYLDLAKRNRACDFYLAGDGPLKEHILTRIRNEGIGVHYLGCLSYADSIRTFSDMNVGVAPSIKTTVRDFAYPIKVFDYLSCGLPVITPDFGEWARVVSKNKCGLVTKTSSGEEFDECLGSLDRRAWQEMSSNGLRLIRDEFNWPSLLEKLDEIVETFR